MIWGEIINTVRNLHAEFFEAFRPQWKDYSPVELNSDSFPYPAETGDYGEWEPPIFPESMMELLELHPVERVLLEGPLLPIQEVTIEAPQWIQIQNAILQLEKQFLQQMKYHQPEKSEFIEKNLHARFMQLQRRSGHQTLKAL
jgi:hypothetical protein